MNKTKTVLAVTGGVIALAVLVMAYFTWDAFSRRAAAFEGDDEGVEGLETYVARVRKLLTKDPYPSAANAKRMDANRTVVEEWREVARKQAAVGDWCVQDDVTPAQFKETVIRDAKRLSSLPGSANGRLMKADFTFGPFKPYLGDVLPAKDQLARLQRQWFDITALCETLATNGVGQITDLQIVDRQAEAAKDGTEAKPKAKGKAKAKAKSADGEGNVREPSVETYRLTFLSDPAVFAAVVRQLSSQERFTVVDSFSFAHERDVLGEALGASGEKKESSEGAATGRRARRRAAAAAAKSESGKEQEKKGGVAFDPAEHATLNVELTVSVYDFRTLEEDKEVSK